MKAIIILNGPPGVGKDTLATRLASYQFAPMQFKNPMFKIARDMLGPVKYKEFLKRYDNRKQKEAVWDYIGMSPRNLMIHISEKFVKPILGQTAFGRLAADEVASFLSGHPYVSGVVFSDGGFESELEDLKKVSGTRTYVIRLHREGYTFECDSRNYMSHADLDILLEEDNPSPAVIKILELINGRI